MKRIICLMTLFFTLNANADVNTSLNRFFSDLNYKGSNYTEGRAWQGQAAGYITGGGLYARTDVNNIQIASMTTPSINAGCGGIDVYLGSFSFISGEELIRFLRSIMSNTVGYAFDLALETVAPSLKSIKDHLQTLAEAVNSTNFSSCEAAQLLVGGVGGAITGSKEVACKSFGRASNKFNDYLQARFECGKDENTNRVAEEAKKEAEYKDMILKDRNLTWYILTEKAKKSELYNDKQAKELLMSLVGTIIFDSNSEVKSLEPLSDSTALLNALMYGGEPKIYICDTDSNCLNPKLETIKIKRENGFAIKVHNMLTSILTKIKNDMPVLTEKEKNLIESTTIPFFKYIVDSMSTHTSELIVKSLSSTIAYDVLHQYINNLISTFKSAKSNMDLPEKVVSQFNNLINASDTKINQLTNQLHREESSLLKFEQQMQYIRSQASSNIMNNYLSNYNF